MELRLQINNPDIERLLVEFVKQQKEDLKEISFETLEFFIKTFRKRGNQKIDIDALPSSVDKYVGIVSQEDADFQNISTVSLEKIWNNKEDEVYDRFLN